MGMSILLILLAVQVLVTVLSFVFEGGEDPRFEDSKVIYRS